jgi:ABC-2 type transport system ATP-binding protein
MIGLLGKNGAGKSTLMKCMLGFLKYEGEVYIQRTVEGRESNTGVHRVLDCFGGKARSDLAMTDTEEYDNLVTFGDHRIFNNVAFIPDVSELDERLTVRQTMDYVKGIHPKWNQTRADKLIQISKLPLDLKVKKLSKGMKTKLYLLITLSLDVDILLLDEPTIGLDIAFKKEFYNTILGEYFDQNKLIFISTHQIEEIEFLLQEIVILDKGKIIVHKDMEELKSEYSIVTLPIERSGELDAFNSMYKTKSLGSVSALLKSDITIEGATYTRPQIAEIFLALTGGYHATD